MSLKSNISAGINRFIYKYIEFDRVAERKVKKSIEIWHRGGGLNHVYAKLMWTRIRKKYNCDYYPGITVGKDLRIEHPMWTCIGKTTVLGDNVRIYNNVLIIAKITGDEERLKTGERRHAKIGNNVVLGSGCTIIGPITIGSNCIIGVRAIVTKDIPENSVVIGINQTRPRRSDENAPEYLKL